MLKNSRETKTFFKNYAEYFDFALLSIFFLISVILIQPWGNYPLNDDWYFSKPALLLSTTGSTHIIDGQAAWGLSQIWLGAALSTIFGFSHSLLRWVGILSLLASAALLHWNLRRSSIPPFLRALALGTFLFFLPNFLNSVSFMSDVPFLALWIWSSKRWSIALQDTTFSKVLTACCVTFLCIAQRQVGIFLLPIVFIFSIIIFQKINYKKFFLIFGGLLFSTLSYFLLSYYWKSILHVRLTTFVPHFNLNRVLQHTFKSFSYAGLAISPFLSLSIKPLWLRIQQERRPVPKALEIASSILLTIAFGYFTFFQIQSHELMPYFQNPISKYGMFRLGEIIGGPRNVLFPSWLLVAVTIISSIGAISLCLHLLVWLFSLSRKAIHEPITFLIASGFCYFFGLVLVSNSIWDRYLVPLFISAIALLAININLPKFHPLQHKLFSYTVVCLFAVGSILIGQDYMKWTQARWQTGEWLVQQGILPENIEGGHEWYWWKLPEPMPAPINYPNKLSNIKKAIIVFGDQEGDSDILHKVRYVSWISAGTIVAKPYSP